VKRFFLFSFSFFLLFVTLLISSYSVYAAGECDSITSIEAEPKKGFKTTDFIISGKTNCNEGVGLQLIAVVDPEHPERGEQSVGITTMRDGYFRAEATKLPSVGIWIIKLMNQVTPLNGELKVLVEQSDDPSQNNLTCGQVAPDPGGSQGDLCPDECPAIYIGRDFFGKDLWRCGGNLPPELAGRCAEKPIDYWLPCLDGKKLTLAKKCGQGDKGFVCDSADDKICFYTPEGGTKTIYCQSDKFPDPTPPCAPGELEPVIDPKDPANPGYKCSGFSTALGVINTDLPRFVQRLFGIILGISGGLALILIIIAGYRIMVSQGNPEALKAAREQLTAALIGLMLIIFSTAILQIIGVDILHIPGLGP